MDPVLKRPMFRKVAFHQEQIRKNKVPGFAIGGLIPLAAQVGRAGMAGLRAFRGAQSARAAAGDPRLIQTLGGPVTRAVQTPTGQKILGAAELGFAGAGAEETRRGLMGEQSIYGEGPASVIGGLTSLYGGTGLVGRTLKTAFPKSIRAAGAGEAITRKTPFPIITPLLGVPAGMAESSTRQAIQEESEKRIPEKQLNALEQKLNELGKNPKVEEVVKTIQGFEITPKQKQAVYDTLGISDFVKGQEPAPQPPAGGEQPPADQMPTNQMPNEQKIQSQMIGVSEPVLDTSKMSSDEKDDLAVTMAGQMDKANKEVANAERTGDDSFKREFMTLKQQIQGATNSGDMTNLILLKLASGLLTGTSRNRGVAGLLDVTGQALGPTVDTAMVLAQQQSEFDQNLAIQLIKDRADRRKDSVVKASQDRKFIVESDPTDALFPEQGRYIPVNKDTGTYLDAVNTPQGEVLTEYTGNGIPEKPDEKIKNTAFNQLNSLATGIEFTQIVQSAPLSTIGPEGRAREIMNRFSGAGKSFMSTLDPIDDFKVKTFNEISDTIMNVNPGDTALSADELKSRTNAANKILTQFQKEDRKVTDQLTDALDSKDEERIARAQLKLIEQRMKYIIANANKGQDRLTVADIKDAEQNTRIFDFLNDPEQIKKNYSAIEKELNSQFKKNAGAYVKNGGSKDYILSKYRNLTPVQQYLLRQDQKKVEETQSKQKDPYAALKGL
jgi:hypothetical protein